MKNLESLIPLADVARSVGLSSAWLRDLVDRGEGPIVVKLGPRTIRARTSDVAAWLAARTISANPQKAA